MTIAFRPFKSRSMSPQKWMCVAIVLSMSVGSILRAESPPEKLAPLEYNHPGLEVDLGVGLWAYPLPMDYDGDGDMDLLVGCPDKPSSGTYFFENPTQDPRVKMPVFKAGVRLGNGYHYMMVSEVNGEVRVVKPAKYYVRDEVTKSFDFSRPVSIDAPANPNASATGRTRGNMWRYVDYDGDGDHDLVVGTGDWTDLGWDHAYDDAGVWRNGPLHGFLYLMTNGGDDVSPRYEKPTKIQAGGVDLDVYGWPCHSFVDFDGDDDLDIVVGNFLDYFTYFQNVGTRTQPRYTAGDVLRNAEGNRLTMNLQMITPTAVDWDGDGDSDLIVGDEDGRVALVENTGEMRDGQPLFLDPVYFRQQADTLKFGALATPTVSDWDGDGDDDILCGNTAGNIGWFENLGDGENGLPKWSEAKLLNVRSESGEAETFRVLAGENGSIQGPCEAKWGYTTLSAADWDGDGDDDIVYNSILAEIGLLINDSGTLAHGQLETGVIESPPVWYAWKPAAANALSQWRTTPIATDWDHDATMDLVLLDQEGYLTWRRSAGVAERLFVDESGHAIRLTSGTAGRSGRVKMALADWDSDGRMDVLVNSENVTWYRNVGERAGKVVLKRIGNLSTRNVAGHTASPAVCDFDRDGKPDLLVGSENGRIYHIFHDDCVTFTEDQIAGKIAFESPQDTDGLPMPRLDRDDAITFDSTRGPIAVWIEKATKAGAPDRIRYAYHDGGNWSKPGLFEWDGMKKADGKCSGLAFDSSSTDHRIMLTWQMTSGDVTQTVRVVSYDRGRTFRDLDE